MNVGKNQRNVEDGTSSKKNMVHTIKGHQLHWKTFSGKVNQAMVWSSHENDYGKKIKETIMMDVIATAFLKKGRFAPWHKMTRWTDDIKKDVRLFG